MTAVSKSAFPTLSYRVDFRVCSAVRVRFRQDLVIFTYCTHTFILTYAWTLITTLGVGVCVTAPLCVSQVTAWLPA